MVKTIVVLICTILLVACGKNDKPIDPAHLAASKAKAAECAGRDRNRCTGGFVSIKDEKGDVFISRITNGNSNEWATVSVDMLIYGGDQILSHYEITLPNDSNWPQVAVLYARQFVIHSTRNQ